MTLTQSLANELKGPRTRVDAVLPTIIDTPANRRGMSNADHSSWLVPEEMAEVILFLVSGRGSLVTGNLIALEK